MSGLKWNLGAAGVGLLVLGLSTAVFNWVLDPSEVSYFKDAAFSLLTSVGVLGCFVYANYRAYRPTTLSSWIKVGVIALVGMFLFKVVTALTILVVYGALVGAH